MTRDDLIKLLRANFEPSEEVLFCTENDELAYAENVEFNVEADCTVVSLVLYDETMDGDSDFDEEEFET